MKESISTGDDSRSVATISRVTGSAGTMTVDFVRDHTSIVMALASLPG